MDCITRGKYGYIDPDGKKREFTYVSGLPCDAGAEDQAQGGDNNELSIQDPIDPAERFRTAQAVQLTDSEIPDSARPRPQRPQAEAAPAVQDQARIRARPRPQTAVRTGSPAAGSAFEDLLNVAGDEQLTVAAPTRRPAQPNRRPVQPVASPAPAGQFDFDSEVDSFTLNKPALTFDPAEQPKAVGPNFSSELVFDPSSGTFKTELRQSIAGQEDIRISQAAQPQGAAAAAAFFLARKV